MSAHDPIPPAGGGHEELPPLPIPRPGEWSPMRAPRSEPVSTPRSLGSIGGASYTAASTGDDPATTPAPNGDREADQLLWHLAAQLTAGMLANSGRAHASVKDAMGLFDQFLHEVHVYARMAAEHDLHAGDHSTRQTHGEYFQRHGERANEETAGPVEPPWTGTTTPSQAPKSTPTQPRPGGAYQAIPPGARGPYSPGSMAGAPPADTGEGEPGSAQAA